MRWPGWTILQCALILPPPSPICAVGAPIPQAHLYVAPLLADLRRRFLDADPIGAAFVNGTERQTR